MTYDNSLLTNNAMEKRRQEQHGHRDARDRSRASRAGLMQRSRRQSHRLQVFHLDRYFYIFSLIENLLSCNGKYGYHDSNTATQRVRGAEQTVHWDKCSECSPKCQARNRNRCWRRLRERV